MFRVAYAGSAPALEPSSGAREGRTVLVVEDEWLIRELIAEILDAEGYQVLAAANADEAVRLLDTEAVDLLFTDIDLGPGADGVALARGARRMRPDLKVVYASGRRQRLEPELAVAGSVFMAKPYRPTDVRDVIGGMLGGTSAG